MARDLRGKLRKNLRSGAFGAAADSSSAPQAEPVPDPVHAPVKPGAGLRAYLAQRAARGRAERLGRPAAPVLLPVAGEVEHTSAGTFWVWRQRYPLRDTLHGTVPLRLASELDWDLLAARGKDERFASARLDECLFIDTETTGLSGGAGTMVFLTGMAFVEKGADGREVLVLEQVFLRNFEEEPAALAYVERRLNERPLPVSFVGKSFDRHRLANRMTLLGIDTGGVLGSRHLDLYYLARRVWGEDLPNCKLRTLEQRRLGFHRDDDLPGSEAPRAWIDWLRDGSGPVDRVLDHNRDDVLSLVALLGLLGRV